MEIDTRRGPSFCKQLIAWIHHSRVCLTGDLVTVFEFCSGFKER